jgi:hypothetical protein
MRHQASRRNGGQDAERFSAEMAAFPGFSHALKIEKIGHLGVQLISFWDRFAPISTDSDLCKSMKIRVL